MRPVRVLYNGTSARVGGGLSYALAQTQALSLQATIDLTVLAAPWNYEHFADALADCSVTLEQARLRSAAHRFFWEQTRLPILARRFDALICPANFGPWWGARQSIIILQNANYVGDGRRLPQNRHWRRRLKIAASHLSMRRAGRVIVISESLARQFAAEKRLAKLPIAVVYSGASASSRETDTLAICRRPYVLVVSNDYPHKRLDDLGQVFPALSSRFNGEIVVVGEVPPERQREIAATSGAGTNLRFLGPIHDRGQVLALYRDAAAYLSLSELEAFPLTIHEAASQGVPLVLTDIPPHRELAGDKARYFPIGDIGALVSQLVDALSADRPIPWNWSFSWDDHAHTLRAVIEEVTQPARVERPVVGSKEQELDRNSQ